MRTKLFFVLLTSILLLGVSSTFAHDEESGETIETIAAAGVTPDSPLYGLDVAWDQLRLFFTFDNTDKARLRIDIARERLLEIKEMIEQNKIDHAETARNRHDIILAALSNAADDISNSDALVEVENEIEIERELEEHEREIEDITNRLRLRIVIEGQLTDEQRALIDSILDSIQNSTGETKITVNIRRGLTEIKIRQQTGFDDDELNNTIRRIEIRQRLFAIRLDKAADQIEDALERIMKVEDLLANVTNETVVNLTTVNNLLSQANEHLDNAEVAFEEEKFGEAFGQARAAERLARNAQRILERDVEEDEDEMELEVEVRIEDGQSRIKIEIGDNEFKFRLPTDNRDEIISIIVENTGLTHDFVSRLIQFESGEEGRVRIQESDGKFEIEIRRRVVEEEDKMDEEKDEEKEDEVKEEDDKMEEDRDPNVTNVQIVEGIGVVTR